MGSLGEFQGQFVQVPEEEAVGDVTSFEPPTLGQEQVAPELAQSGREGRAGNKGRRLPWHLAAATSRSFSKKCGS